VLVRKAHERLPKATFVAGSIEQLDARLGPFDVLGFFDVLEHLDDPSAVLGRALAHARPGALVIATVPALRSLFSAVDALSGHKRRYEVGELEQIFQDAGLVDVEAHGLFRLLLPLLRLRRAKTKVPGDLLAQRRLLLSDMRTPASPLNRLLRAACALEARLAFSGSGGKAGPTLLVVGRLPA
jgi:Methyltransferase domain